MNAPRIPLTILRTELVIERGHSGFCAMAKVPTGSPVGVTVVGIGDSIEGALTDLARQLGPALDPDGDDS